MFFFLLVLVAVIGFFLRFEDDSIESAKTVKQWNVKIISVRYLTHLFLNAVMLVLLLRYDLLNRGTCSVCFQISKNKRHQDRAAALEVWEKLEEFVRSRSHS